MARETFVDTVRWLVEAGHLERPGDVVAWGDEAGHLGPRQAGRIA